MESIVKVKEIAGKIRIEISIKDLIQLAARHPEEPIKVVNRKEFIDEVINQIENYQESNDTENGCSHIEWFFDQMTQEACVNVDETVAFFKNQD